MANKIYKDFCDGKLSFGATSANTMEAVLLVFKAHEPSKSKLALEGLRKTIDLEREKGKTLVKLSEMYERMGAK